MEKATTTIEKATTTIENLTPGQISALRKASADAGVDKLVKLCDRARNGNLSAMEKIVAIFRAKEEAGQEV